jgi:fermentation-respiration switch protein FrsA (DUF1100 family)
MASNGSGLSSFWVFFLGLFGVYAVLGLLLFLFQSHLLYFPNVPSRTIFATPKAIGLGYERVRFLTGDGIRLDGWFVPARKARGVVLFFHGNAGNISHRLDSLRIFNGLGLSTLIFDYRGYGRSEGAPSEEGTYRDAKAAWRYLTDARKVARERIVFFGRSLGGAVAAHLANQQSPRALILESVFTSVPDIAAQHYRIFPVRWLSRFGYETRKFIRTVRCPVLIVHSRDDEIIPVRHGRELLDAANLPKRFLGLRGGHNDGFLVSGRSYIDGLDAFLTEYLGKQDG